MMEWHQDLIAPIMAPDRWGRSMVKVLSDADLTEDQANDRAMALWDHRQRMQFGFDRSKAWCDALHAMSDTQADLNPLSMFLIAEAIEGVLDEMRRDWSGMIDALE